MTISGNLTGVKFHLSQRMDLFGYTCQTIPTSFVASATKLALSSDDTSQMVPLPFAFCHYIISYSNAYVSANGYLSFKELDPTYSSPENKEIQDYWEPDAAIYAFWDNLLVDANAGIYTAAQGSAPNRQFIIEWRNVARADDPTKRVSFEIMLHESGPILLQYAIFAANNLERGGSATVEMENANSYIAFQYASDQPVLSNSRAIRFMPPFTNLL